MSGSSTAEVTLGERNPGARLALYHADWMLFTRSDRFLSATPAVPPPNLPPAKPKVRWTDGYSNLFQLLK